MIYDAAIIGSGPAGISAALNLKIHQRNFLWFGSAALSEKVRRAEKIENYPGLAGVSGEAFFEALQAQLRQMELEPREQMVTSIMPLGDRYAIMAENDFFEVKSVILATGMATVGTLLGESALLGRGVSYCATCDGRLYRGKSIAVIATNRRFEHEVRYLSELAEHVFFFPLYREPGKIAENVQIMPARAVGVIGEDRIRALQLHDGSELLVDGLFCLRDAISLQTLLPSLQTENGHIAVDRAMATNLPGCFAAGDCTGRPYQYAKAVGEGNVAAHSVLQYLAE